MSSGACRRCLCCSSAGLFCLIYPRDCGSATRWSIFGRSRERNFAACCIIIFCAYGALYASSTSLPALLQTLFGYDAYHSGLVLSPSGISSILVLIIVGGLLGPRNRRTLVHRVGLDCAGNFRVLDVALQPADQPVAGRLAAGGVDRRLVDDFRPASTWPPTSIRPANYEGRRLGSSRSCATKGAASGLRWPKRSRSDVRPSTTLRLGEHLDPYNPIVRDVRRTLASGPLSA